MPKQFRVAVDFDGTLVKHDFPDIVAEVPGAFVWLRRWKEAGAMLILWTMRSDGQKYGPVLSQAVEYCRVRGVLFDGVNEGPGDREWTESPKVYAHRYVDDAACGCPLQCYPGHRPVVDWDVVGPDVLRDIREYNDRWAPRAEVSCDV